MRRTTSDLWTTLTLAVGGVLAGHALAYGSPAAHVHSDGATHLHVHGYLPVLAAIVVPIAVLALLAHGIAEIRDGVRRIRLGHLLAFQCGLFVVQETIERIAAGGASADILREPVLWAGLLAQVIVAGSTLGLARAIANLASATRGTALRTDIAQRARRRCLPIVHLAYPSASRVSTSAGRAPPLAS